MDDTIREVRATVNGRPTTPLPARTPHPAEDDTAPTAPLFGDFPPIACDDDFGYALEIFFQRAHPRISFALRTVLNAVIDHTTGDELYGPARLGYQDHESYYVAKRIYDEVRGALAHGERRGVGARASEGAGAKAAQ